MKKYINKQFIKNNYIILLGILFLFGISVYYSYAYFSQVVSGNDRAKTIETTTGILKLEYKDSLGEVISVYNAMPGATASKRFTVENIGTLDATYDILWKDVVNYFVNKSDLQYTLTCSSDGDNECREVTSSTQMPNTTNNQEIVKSVSISPGEVHTYDLELSFLYRDANQNVDQGKSVTANVQIVQATESIVTMDIQNGTLDNNNATLEYGETASFVVTPNDGYLLENMNVTCNHTSNITIINNTITIGPVYLSNNCDITFTPAYNIHGYVLDNNEQPVSGATVQVHSEPRTATTDVTGYFELNNVVVGEHELTVTRDSDTLHNSSFSIEEGEDISIADNIITASNPNVPIKIKVTINSLSSKSITRDFSYRVAVFASNARTASSLEIVQTGEDVTIPVTPEVGYDYNSIECTNGETGVWNNNIFTLSSVDNDTVCTIGFGASVYNLSLVSGTESGTIYKNVVYNEIYGDFPTVTKNNYSFDGWYTAAVGGTKITSSTVVTTASDHSLYAHWIPDSNNVIYNCSENGGSCNIDSVDVPYGSNIDLSKTGTKEGYSFLGWNTDKDATSVINSLIMDEDNVTLYAIFEKTINVTYSSNGATLSKESDSCTIYNNSSSCTFTSPTIARVGYEIEGFNNSSSDETSVLDYNTNFELSSDTTYYAITYKDISTVFDKNGNINQMHYSNTYTTNTITVACRVYNTEESCNITSPRITPSSVTPIVLGYSASSSDRTISLNQNTPIDVSANNTYYAQSRSNEMQFDVTYNKGSNVSSISKQSDSCVIPSSYNGALQETSCTFTLPRITPLSGYTNKYWSTSSSATSGLNQESEITVSTNITYYAIANDISAPTISYSSNGDNNYSKSHNVSVTVSDYGSGLGANQKLKYGWSSSPSTPPSTYTSVSLGNASGIKTSAFVASSTNTLTGIYYLWVVPNTNLCDVSNNCTSSSSHVSSPYYFDNTPPSCTLTATVSGKSVTLTMEDIVENESGVNENNYGLKYSSEDDYTLSYSNYYTFYSLPASSYTGYGYIEDYAGNYSTCTDDFEIEIRNLYSIVSGEYPVLPDNTLSFATINSNSRVYYTTDLSKTEDIDGDGTGEVVYYFRGGSNNFVVFSGFCWVIVRTNEDKSTRLMYYNVANGNSCSYGADTSMVVDFNEMYDPAEVGYMHGSEGASNYANTHANTYDSDAKDLLDAWYSGGVADNAYCDNNGSFGPCNYTSLSTPLIDSSSYIANTMFCNDRSIYSGTGYGSGTTYFSAYGRLQVNKTPQFKCINNADKFTLSVAHGGTSGYGNNKLTYPVGLITADELAFAGFVYDDPNFTGNFLDYSDFYLTMTPYNFTDGAGHMFNFGKYNSNNPYGADSSIYNVYSSEVVAVMPVISIKASVEITRGYGSVNSPYIIN